MLVMKGVCVLNNSELTSAVPISIIYKWKDIRREPYEKSLETWLS